MTKNNSGLFVSSLLTPLFMSVYRVDYLPPLKLEEFRIWPGHRCMSWHGVEAITCLKMDVR